MCLASYHIINVSHFDENWQENVVFKNNIHNKIVCSSRKHAGKGLHYPGFSS